MKRGDRPFELLAFFGVFYGSFIGSLGNAEGFGDEPMISIAEAKLSLRLLPLLLRREAQVSTHRRRLGMVL